MDSATHQRVQAETRQRRNAAARERRADGYGYRKVPIVVRVVDALDDAGAAIVLATSDVAAERGRYFLVVRDGGRWKCSCGLFRSVGGCHHVGHLAAARP